MTYMALNSHLSYEGGPDEYVVKILFFCDFNPHVKFQNSTITPSGRKVSEAERKKKKERQEGFLPCQTPTYTVRLKVEGCRVKNGG